MSAALEHFVNNVRTQSASGKFSGVQKFYLTSKYLVDWIGNFGILFALLPFW